MRISLPPEQCKNACSTILSYLCALLPETIPSYCEPSLPFLSTFWRDPYGMSLSVRITPTGAGSATATTTRAATVPTTATDYHDHC
jgi:hypothetical protein